MIFMLMYFKLLYPVLTATITTAIKTDNNIIPYLVYLEMLIQSVIVKSPIEHKVKMLHCKHYFNVRNK